MRFNADLHIHGRFSAATSSDMYFPNLAKGAEQKGVQMVATGDCLHPEWLKEIRAMMEVDEGTFQQGGTNFILTTEVEAEKRVHHLLLFPSISSVEDFIERLGPLSARLEADGRPRLPLGGEELAQMALDTGAMIGPAHAFTPWTGMYAHFESLKGCYGELASKIPYLELGLSANSEYGDRIPELANLTFLTNSDAHSPQPVRVGREFNTIEAKDITFKELTMAIKRQKGRKFVRNIGLPPEEGKYNRSACSRCFAQYELDRALALRWKCVCGGSIKKGVRERAMELGGEVRHPSHRPEYFYMIPLGEIIAKAVGHSSPFTGKVNSIWQSLVDESGTEVEVLMKTPIERLTKTAGDAVANAILAFREGKITVLPGGGGKYGTVLLPGQEPAAVQKAPKGQKNLFDY
ncbi:MAG: TIGR00375 family protein [Candidatus Thermoplasmatota archaeon]|nr:TIGR00375 family protein [Euryarchaeota archaeon]MBU4031250.1 TIGR00375 family protein [Candidatus Thermoplasmatota archaeon]MBU4071377.1 TIGR00375 family protein [Candidatus Thermoplasmatota archaeon]MBU4143481.1 TIGR00375 family protein [Candidatus Thermoplasmatota archaeon]MBU4591715.1 TIGR00375 family protein [Candidatus Thermoplasmatota archaeon]